MEIDKEIIHIILYVLLLLIDQFNIFQYVSNKTKYLDYAYGKKNRGRTGQSYFLKSTSDNVNIGPPLLGSVSKKVQKTSENDNDEKDGTRKSGEHSKHKYQDDFYVKNYDKIKILNQGSKNKLKELSSESNKSETNKIHSSGKSSKKDVRKMFLDLDKSSNSRNSHKFENNSLFKCKKQHTLLQNLLQNAEIPWKIIKNRFSSHNDVPETAINNNVSNKVKKSRTPFTSHNIRLIQDPEVSLKTSNQQFCEDSPGTSPNLYSKNVSLHCDCDYHKKILQNRNKQHAGDFSLQNNAEKNCTTLENGNIDLLYKVGCGFDKKMKYLSRSNKFQCVERSVSVQKTLENSLDLFEKPISEKRAADKNMEISKIGDSPSNDTHFVLNESYKNYFVNPLLIDCKSLDPKVIGSATNTSNGSFNHLDDPLDKELSLHPTLSCHDLISLASQECKSTGQVSQNREITKTENSTLIENTKNQLTGSFLTKNEKHICHECCHSIPNRSSNNSPQRVSKGVQHNKLMIINHLQRVNGLNRADIVSPKPNQLTNSKLKILESRATQIPQRKNETTQKVDTTNVYVQNPQKIHENVQTSLVVVKKIKNHSSVHNFERKNNVSVEEINRKSKSIHACINIEKINKGTNVEDCYMISAHCLHKTDINSSEKRSLKNENVVLTLEEFEGKPSKLVPYSSSSESTISCSYQITLGGEKLNEESIPKGKHLIPKAEIKTLGNKNGVLKVQEIFSNLKGEGLNKIKESRVIESRFYKVLQSFETENHVMDVSDPKKVHSKRKMSSSEQRFHLKDIFEGSANETQIDDFVEKGIELLGVTPIEQTWKEIYNRRKKFTNSSVSLCDTFGKDFSTFGNIRIESATKMTLENGNKYEECGQKQADEEGIKSQERIGHNETESYKNEDINCLPLIKEANVDSKLSNSIQNSEQNTVSLGASNTADIENDNISVFMDRSNNFPKSKMATHRVDTETISAFNFVNDVNMTSKYLNCTNNRFDRSTFEINSIVARIERLLFSLNNEMEGRLSSAAKMDHNLPNECKIEWLTDSNTCRVNHSGYPNERKFSQALSHCKEQVQGDKIIFQRKDLFHTETTKDCTSENFRQIATLDNNVTVLAPKESLDNMYSEDQDIKPEMKISEIAKVQHGFDKMEFKEFDTFRRCTDIQNGVRNTKKLTQNGQLTLDKRSFNRYGRNWSGSCFYCDGNYQSLIESSTNPETYHSDYELSRSIRSKCLQCHKVRTYVQKKKPITKRIKKPTDTLLENSTNRLDSYSDRSSASKTYSNCSKRSSLTTIYEYPSQETILIMMDPKRANNIKKSFSKEYVVDLREEPFLKLMEPKRKTCKPTCHRHHQRASTVSAFIMNGVNGHTNGDLNGCDIITQNQQKGCWTIGLINSKYKYLTAETFGFKINANGSSLKKKQIWTLEPDLSTSGESYIYLKSHLEKYLAVDSFGNVTCENEEKDPGSKFLISVAEDGTGRWAFRNVVRGYFLGASLDKLTCTAKIPGDSEFWHVHLAARPQVNLRSVGRKRFAHLSESQEEIYVDANIPWGEDTLFTLEFRADESGKYALHTCNNKYLSLGGKLVDKCTSDCLFTAEYHSGYLALRDKNGAYLSPIGSKAVLKTRSNTVTKDELFSLEDSLPQASFVAALNTKYVSVKQGVDVTANQDEISDHETFQLEFDWNTKRWYIRTMQDRYWTLETGGGIQAVGDKRSSNALFDLIWQGDGSVAFRANNGRYVTTKRSGHLYANSDTIDENSKYFFYLINRPILVLKSEQGFVGYKSGNITKLECNKAMYETIQVERAEKGIVYFKGQNGKYWHCDSEGVTADSDTPEGFYLELREPTRLSIKSVSGSYLTASKNGVFRLGDSSYESATQWEY